MTFKEIFHINNLISKIRLDHSDIEHGLKDYQNSNDVEKKEVDKFLENEWNQEYELIYLSYVLEK